jgi:tRNA 5-methylaminomethyl-2-thiouridine biosynthesis bifunctional protein
MQFATIEWRQDSEHKGLIQPYSLDFNDIYYSTESGQHESEYVFLAHNHLHTRFAAADGKFVVVETGFGTGLNFLVVADCWRRVAPDDASLHYIAYELYPLTLADMQKACACWPAYQHLSQALLSNYGDLKIGGNHFYLPNNITLTIVVADIQAGLAAINNHVNAWLLDGYSPAKNADMWSDTLFTRMANLSTHNTTFATFTSAGQVRRGLQAAGFKVKKHKGFGKKREMLSGVFVSSHD